LYTACPILAPSGGRSEGAVLVLTLVTETPFSSLAPNPFALAATASLVPLFVGILLILNSVMSGRVTKHLKDTINSAAHPEAKTPDSLLFTIAQDAPLEIQQANAAIKEVFKKVQENTAFLTATFEASPLGILQIAPEGTLLYANSFFLESSGLPLDEAKGLGWFKAIHPDERATFAVDWYAALQQKGAFEGYQRLLTPSGEVRHAIIKARTIKSNSKSEGFIATVLDVTETKQAIDATTAARDAAEAATRSKSEFLAAVSHELKTPLNTIFALSQMLVTDPQSYDLKESLHTIRDASHRLFAILSDLLDLSKVEAGKMELEPVQFELRPFLKRTVTLMSPRAQEKGISLHLDISDSVAHSVYGDDVRLGQVLINLIGNGIKFTRNGGKVELFVAPCKDPSFIEFSIRDSGVGIPQDRLKVILNPYDHGDEPGAQRKIGVTGLGLHVSQRLIKLLGGVLRVESHLNRGSNFTFSAILPQISHGDERPGESSEDEIPTLRILLAEDNLTNQQITTRILTQMGHKVLAVANGEDALRAVRNEPGYGFDVILMDYNMPIMDGLEATRQIRSLEEETGLHTPIIALTANTMVWERDACLEAGMDDFIGKPIKIESFKELVHKWGIKSRAGRPY
jgi:PAS domain S-box-containing protein